MKSILNAKVGTPKTLDEAVQRAICIGPMNEIKERSYHVLKDFMAQKFSIAMAQAELAGEPTERLEALFKSLTERPK